MIRTPEQDLAQRMRDPEYAKLYGAADAKVEFAVTLAKARQEAKKTQKELADAIGHSQPYVAKLEGGDANPTLGTVGSLLAVLGCRLKMHTVPLFLQLTTATHVSSEDTGGLFVWPTKEVSPSQRGLSLGADEPYSVSEPSIAGATSGRIITEALSGQRATEPSDLVAV